MVVAVSRLDQSLDVLLSILGLLPLPDLLAMSGVSRRLRSLLEPRLYSTVETRLSHESTPPLALLLRSLLERPERATYIRHLRLVGDGYTDDGYVGGVPDGCVLDALSVSRASEIIQSTGVPYAEQWVDRLQAGVIDAVVAVLVIMAPNLESLYLGPEFTIESRFLGKTLSLALCGSSAQSPTLPAFHSLRHVVYSRRVDENQYRDINNAADVLPLFHVPNLETLSISVDNPADFAWPAQAPPTAALLTSLELYRLRERWLAPLLTPLRQLRKLQYNWFYEADLDTAVSTSVVELDTMAAALGKVGHTLTDLTIKAEIKPAIMDGESEDPRIQIRASLRGLVCLDQLTRLSLPWVFVKGFTDSEATGSIRDLLAPNIEHLTLTEDLIASEQWDWHCDSIVAALGSDLDAWTRPFPPSLKSIALPVHMTEDRGRELEPIGERLGLEIVWLT